MQAYIDLLNLDPAHFGALTELARIALDTGHRSAARTAYRQAVQCHGGNPLGRVNLGNVYLIDGDPAAAREQYEAALAADQDFPEAHQGLARALEELGDIEAAKPHWRLGFTGHALVPQRYRGRKPAEFPVESLGSPLDPPLSLEGHPAVTAEHPVGRNPDASQKPSQQPAGERLAGEHAAGPPSIKVLLLVSTRYGNIATQLILDDRIFEVFALYVDYYDPEQYLPPHTVVFNAIGDADLCGETLERAASMLSHTLVPVINGPAAVLRSGRVENARRLAGLPGVVAPATRAVARAALADPTAQLRFPMLLRSPGFHMGSHFVRVERQEDLSGAAAELPGEELLAIEYLDARGADGMARKYRVMYIDGRLYPLHLAVSADWKVHYFSAAMATEPSFREEERRFLDAMPAVLGRAAMSALECIGATLALDYAGIDFGIGADGSVLLFEANATMVIVPPPADPIWNYRRAAIGRALDAAQRMVLVRAA